MALYSAMPRAASVIGRTTGSGHKPRQGDSECSQPANGRGKVDHHDATVNERRRYGRDPLPRRPGHEHFDSRRERSRVSCEALRKSTRATGLLGRVRGVLRLVRSRTRFMACAASSTFQNSRAGAQSCRVRSRSSNVGSFLDTEAARLERRLSGPAAGRPVTVCVGFRHKERHFAPGLGYLRLLQMPCPDAIKYPVAEASAVGSRIRCRARGVKTSAWRSGSHRPCRPLERNLSSLTIHRVGSHSASRSPSSKVVTSIARNSALARFCDGNAIPLCQRLRLRRTRPTPRRLAEQARFASTLRRWKRRLPP